MDEVKCKLTLNQSLEEKIKKSRSSDDQSISCIEHLSNEIFYEIFDYLVGGEIYEAFSNLNDRFEQLLHSSSLLFKLKFRDFTSEEIFINKYKQIFAQHRHQILSIDISLPYQDDHFILWFTFDFSLTRLESIVINCIKEDMLVPLLVNLASLLRLFSLTIYSCDIHKSVNDVYRLLFSLPTLKYCNIMPYGSSGSISLPMATNEQLSTIESFIIDHCYSCNELISLISYMPQLRRLSFNNAGKYDPRIGVLSPKALSNLTYLYMYSQVTFNELEIFLLKICSKLNDLRIFVHEDSAFLNDHRWKQFILQHLPVLEKFYLEYYETVDDDFQYPIYSGELNPFSSSFWIERRCVFGTEINGEDITYKVSTYRKIWYEYSGKKIVESCSKSTKLTIKYVDIDEVIPFDTKRILTIVQIYYLEIPKSKISVDHLIRIIDLLPDLTILKIHSLSIRQSKDIEAEELLILRSAKEKSKITKVYLEVIDGIEDFCFLINLCPYMSYLQMDCIHNMSITSFLQTILQRSKDGYDEHFRSLCFRIPALENETITNLVPMMNDIIPSVEYQIERVLDHIYIQWK